MFQKYLKYLHCIKKNYKKINFSHIIFCSDKFQRKKFTFYLKNLNSVFRFLGTTNTFIKFYMIKSVQSDNIISELLTTS